MNQSASVFAGGLFLVLLASAFFASPKGAWADFELRDGDRVVFLGDSLTGTRAYGEIVELYTLCSFADRKVEFINAGVGGDTAQGGLKRLQETVLKHKPTVVTVCYGINDIGWGMKANDESMKQYLDGMTGIIDQCQKAGARVVVMTPCPTKLADPESTNPDFLKEMGNRVLAIALEKGAIPVDLYTDFRDIQRRVREAKKDKDFQTHGGDGIHLAEFGNLAFAYVLLKGMGAPDTASALTIDAKSLSVSESARCKVEGMVIEGKEIRFTRIDNGWPLFLGALAGFQFPFIPSDEKLSRYELKVTGLESDEWYDVMIQGRYLGIFSRGDLEKGLNLAYRAPDVWGGFPPWRALSNALRNLLQADTKIRVSSYDASQMDPRNKKIDKAFAKQSKKTLSDLRALIRAQRPIPLQYELRPASPSASPDSEKQKMSDEQIRSYQETINSPWSPDKLKEMLRKKLEVNK